MQNIIEIVKKSFEEIKLEDETWFEFWSARDLMKSLGYKEWRKFNWVIEKAEIACNNTSNKGENHFVPSDKMVWIWSWSKRFYLCYDRL